MRILLKDSADLQGAVRIFPDTAAVKFIPDPHGQCRGEAEGGLHPEQGRDGAGEVRFGRIQLSAEKFIGQFQPGNPGKTEGAVFLAALFKGLKVPAPVSVLYTGRQDGAGESVALRAGIGDPDDTAVQNGLTELAEQLIVP